MIKHVAGAVALALGGLLARRLYDKIRWPHGYGYRTLKPGQGPTTAEQWVADQRCRDVEERQALQRYVRVLRRSGSTARQDRNLPLAYARINKLNRLLGDA